MDSNYNLKKKNKKKINDKGRNNFKGVKGKNRA